MEAELIKAIKAALWKFTKKQGTFGCFEVTIGWFGTERVDYMTYDTKDAWRCYEIKISKSDFHSKNHNTFVGDFNYYAMPKVLYEQVKDEIPDGVGVCLFYEHENFNSISLLKRPKRQPIGVDTQILKNSMIRSLFREVEMAMKCTDLDTIRRYQRELDRSHKVYNDLEKRMADVKNELYYLKHPERKKDWEDCI